MWLGQLMGVRDSELAWQQEASSLRASIKQAQEWDGFFGRRSAEK
jgi:hypothetical protein